MLKSKISALFLMFCACTLLGAYIPLDKIHNNPEYSTNDELVNNVETSTNNERDIVDNGCKRHCGVITKKNNAALQSYDGKVIFLDRFGNLYTKEELSVDRSMMKCPDAGYFALEFLSGFTPEEEATICQVFTDVSALITPQSQLLDIAIPIRVRKDNLESGAYGAATAFYRADLPSGGCGVEQNMVWEHINTSADFDHFLQTGDVAGEYIVNSNLGSENSWHTLDMDNDGDFDDPQVASGNIDLYSVTLHEVMHMLGFTSRITPDGSPLNGFYSFWDQQLFSNISASPAPASSPLSFIVPVANDPDCCDAHEYNSGIGATPSALNLACNAGSQAPAFYQFGPNSADVATVFGDYAPGVINDPLDEMINILSHLNSECDGAEYYVMDSGFGAGQDRRILTDTELAILCNLGYDLNPIEANVTICEPACHVVAMDHFITIPSDAVGNDIQVTLLFSDLIANGYVPSSNYTIVVTDVDPFANILIEEVSDGVRVSNMQPGYSYSLQYSITIDDVLCQACDEGNITIIVEMDGNDTTVPTIVDCDNTANLLPWGNFESFPAEGTEGFLSTYNLPICDPLGINTILSQNSPGVVTASSSQMGYLRGKIAGDNQSTTNCESIYFPLSKPISPGCTASFSLDYRTHYDFSNGDVGNIQVYLSHSQPCVMPEYADCGTPDPADGFQCIESGIEIWSPISSPITHNGAPWTNNTPHEITYIVISNNANAIYSGTAGQGSAPVLIDNIMVTQECANTLTVTPTVEAECYNGGIIIDYEVCLSGTDTDPRDVDLTLNLPNVPGVSFGNGDFSGTELTLVGVEPGAENCQTVRLILNTQGSVLGEGNEFDISLDATAYASCFEGPVETSLVLSSCTIGTITPTVEEECYNGNIIIDYEICLNGTDAGPFDVDLTLNLPNIPGVSFGDGDFTGSQLTLEGMMPGVSNCQTVRLVLNTQGSALENGDEYTILLDATAGDIYFENPVETSLILSSCIIGTITPTVLAECHDAGIIIDYEICHSGTGPHDVDLSLSLPNVLGVSFGDGDFSGPQLTIGGVDNCQTVRLILNTQGSELEDGDEYTILLDAMADDIYFENPLITSLVLSPCVIGCKTPEAGFTYTSDCEEGTFTLTANDPSGLHNWTVNGVYYFGNPLTLPILDLASNDTYTIEHSVLNECLETDTEVRDILITSCSFTCPCEGPNAINIKAGNGTSFTEIDLLDPLISTGPDGKVLAAQDYCISLVGKLLIDDIEPNAALYDLLFEVGELRMNPGAEIIIGKFANVSISGADDGINTSEIYGCDYMWSGIVIENEASLELQHLLIQDAQHAVRLNDNSTLQVDNNTFSRNFIGIYHLDDSEINITEYSNTFDGNAPLLPPYDEFAVPPYQIQARSAAGIFFRSIGSGAQATCFFGSDSESKSIYRDLPVGISGYGNANIEIKNSEFTNIWSTAGVDYPIEGIAVGYRGFLQSASNISINGTTGSIQPVFESCQTAIDINRGAVSITNTQLANCETGFSVSNVTGRPLDISDNELVFFDTGIELTDNDDASSFTVSNNVMKKVLAYGSLAYGGNGINIEEELGRSGDDFATVQGNEIYLAAGLEGTAIFADRSSNLRILDNAPIQLRRSSNDIGINMMNGIGNLVDGNEIYNVADGGEPGSRTGLIVENTTKTTYSCNNFYELHTGARFVAGNCSDTDFQNNYFKPPMAYGLYYEDGLTINTQEWRANRWDGKASFYTEYAAYNEITPANDDAIIAQRYLVHSPSNGFFPPSIHLPNYGGSEPWFVLDNSGSIPLCQTEGVVPPGGGALNEGNTGIPQLMHVFPNPVRDLLTIDLSLSESADLLIMNNLGQVMLKDRLDAGDYSKQIDVSSFAEGVYYIQLITRDANSLSKKVVVLH